jgi:hypothetical protein
LSGEGILIKEAKKKFGFSSAGSGVFHNPVFFIVCVLVIVTPLFRASVHLWAHTVIQILVALGLILLIVEKLRANKGVNDSNSIDRNTSTRSVLYLQFRKGLTVRQAFLYVVLPCIILGIWSAFFSPHPAMTAEGIIMLFFYLIFFYLMLASVRTRQEQRTLVWVIVGTAVFLCIVGLLELFDIFEFPWWDYSYGGNQEPYSSCLTGAYVNHNHIAGFLEMAIPMLLCMFLTGSRPLKVRIVMVCLVLFLIICQALTLSRGGWAATAGAMLFMAAVLLLKKAFIHKRLVGTLVVSALLLAVVTLTSTTVIQRINTLTQRDMKDNISGRLIFWASTRNMIADNLLTGTGPGTYSASSLAYLEPGLAVLPVYAHNDYLEFAADIGILFFPLMLWLLFLFFRIAFAKLKSRSRQTIAISLGCMSSVVAILIHSFSDGNLHIPANTILFIAISALVFIHPRHTLETTLQK